MRDRDKALLALFALLLLTRRKRAAEVQASSVPVTSPAQLPDAASTPGGRVTAISVTSEGGSGGAPAGTQATATQQQLDAAQRGQQ